MDIKDLGLPTSVVNMKTSKDKTISLDISNHLGVGNDRVKINISNIPAAAARQVQLNIRPGISGIDIIADSRQTNATISVETVIDGKSSKYQYETNIEGGMRLRPSSILTDGELKVGKIDNLFGQIQKVTHLKKK